MKEIKIDSPSRLHFGQIDLNGSFGRIYGGIGIGIDRPNFTILGRKSEKLMVSGPGADKVKRVAWDFLEKLRQRDFLTRGSSVEINIEDMIPSHVGLGSGTQIGLTIGYLINRLYQLNIHLKDLARLVDRQQSRSGIGYAVFNKGGFIVDGGRPVSQRYNHDYLPPIVFQHPVPEDWCFVLVLPEASSRGLSGKEESKAFKKLPPMDNQVVAENSRRVLLQMIPSVLEDNIEVFGESLVNIQKKVGDYFEDYQNGRYATDISGAIIDRMLKKGAAGAGQSSWGPLLYCLCRGEEKALEIKTSIKEYFSNGIADIFIAYPDNEGAKVTPDML